MRPKRIGLARVSVAGITVTVRDAVYYPPEPATQIDPPEAEFVEWETVEIAGQDASELFGYPANADLLTAALINLVEG